MNRLFWKSLATRLDGGHSAFLVLVGDSTDGSPGTAGARMFITDEGEQFGTIGGGIMEYRILDQAREALAAGEHPTHVLTLWHTKEGPGEKSGMICAGRQTNLYHLSDPDRDLGVIRRLAELTEAGESGTLLIDREGLRLTEGGVDLADPPIRITLDGDDFLYEEQILNRKRIAILGGGHCGLALSRVMHGLGYDVFVYDLRPDVDTLERNSHARLKSVVADFREAGPAIEYPELTPVVVMTTDYPSDVRALSGALPRPFPYVGLMGSPTKIARIKADLQEEGFDRERLDSIHAPIGIPIGSHTPEEIAISVAAEILKER